VTGHTGNFDGRGGVRIHYRTWLPEGEAKAVLVISHGAGEHGARYGHNATRLVDAGYAVYAPDHRGHGESGKGAQIDRMANAVADLHTMVELARSEQPGRRLYLLGHSMGGCIAIEYAFAHQDALDGLVLSNPVAALEAASPVQRIAGRILSAIAPGVGVFGVESDLISRDPAVVADYDADPLVHHGKLPARTVAELARAVDRFEERAPEITVPLLLLSAPDEQLVPAHGGRMIHERASSQDKTIKEYPGLRHEILNEPEWPQVTDDLRDWLDSQVAKGSVARASA
jgi:alpha-beta hydrolase superfamily lysophospholipase